MKKKGSTLLESIIALFVLATVIILLLEALAVGITGTMNVSRQSSALNLAKTQMDSVRSMPYNATIGDGNLSKVYGYINTSNFSDTRNYNVSGRVESVSGNGSLQKITTNVSYLPGKNVTLVTYKSSPTALNGTVSNGMMVTDVIEDVPFITTGGFWMWGQWCGYYHVFNTTAPGKISATWKFHWTRDAAGWASPGAPQIEIYGPDPSTGQAPAWAQRDYLGVVYPDGILCRGGSVLCGGCSPHDSGTCARYITGDYDPLPGSNPGENCVAEALGLAECLLCGSGQACKESPWWYDDYGCSYSRSDLDFEFTAETTSVVPAGTYTVLFFNGETSISFNTTSASVIYMH